MPFCWHASTRISPGVGSRHKVGSSSARRLRTKRGHCPFVTTQTDKSYSYTDATSFAIMGRLGLRTAFAFDPHFRQFGFHVVGLR